MSASMTSSTETHYDQCLQQMTNAYNVIPVLPEQVRYNNDNQAVYDKEEDDPPMPTTNDYLLLPTGHP